MNFLIFARVMMSWIVKDYSNPIVQFIYQVTEPILAPIRRILPFDFRHTIDISPLVVFLAIIFLKSFLRSTLIGIAMRLR